MYGLFRLQREECGELRKEKVKYEPTAKVIQFRGLFYSKKKKTLNKLVLTGGIRQNLKFVEAVFDFLLKAR